MTKIHKNLIVDGSIESTQYKDGSVTGTPIYNLALNSDGKFITTPLLSGGTNVIITGSTINVPTPNLEEVTTVDATTTKGIKIVNGSLVIGNESAAFPANNGGVYNISKTFTGSTDSNILATRTTFNKTNAGVMQIGLHTYTYEPTVSGSGTFYGNIHVLNHNTTLGTISTVEGHNVKINDKSSINVPSTYGGSLFINVEGTGVGTNNHSIVSFNRLNLNNINKILTNTKVGYFNLIPTSGTLTNTNILEVNCSSGSGEFTGDLNYLRIIGDSGLNISGATVRVISTNIDAPSEFAGSIQAKSFNTITGTANDILLANGTTTSLNGLTRTDLLTDYGFTDNSSNWNTAYNWGDHSLVGYSTQTLTAGTGINISGSVISSTGSTTGPTPTGSGNTLNLSNNITGIIYNKTTPSTDNSFTVTNLVRGGFVTNYINTTGKSDFPTVTNPSGSVIPSKSDAFREGGTFKMMIETDGTNIELFYIDYLNLTGSTSSGTTYTAGANINIDGSNVISATYTAGTGISITNGVIAATGGGGGGSNVPLEAAVNGTGIVLAGRNNANYGVTGAYAFDISESDEVSSWYGAYGVYSFAYGYKTAARGHRGLAGGLESEAIGQNSVALGSYSKANQNVSFALGQYATADARVSIALGHAVTASSYAEVSIGINGTIQAGNTVAFDPIDRVFNVGNGDTAPSDAFTILKNGTITAPSLTNTLIDTAGGKAIITKEYGDLNYYGALVYSPTGNTTGIIKNGRVSANYGAVGINAVDLSYSTTTQGSRGATGENSFATGLGTRATGLTSFTMGESSIASGQLSFAGGRSSTSNNLLSFTFGEQTKAYGQYSTSFGNRSEASGDNSFAGGFSTTASGILSFAFGTQATATSYAEISLGMNPTLYTGNPTNNNIGTDRIFNVGNGTHPTNNRSDAITILKNGQTGIGINNFETNSTGERLQVNGKIKASSINFTGLPTSASGLSAGDVWNNAGVLTIV